MIISGGIAWTAVTPTVFWAVIAVIAVMPWTPQAANAFRSAWMPAPPPESEPAMDRTRGMRSGGHDHERSPSDATRVFSRPSLKIAVASGRDPEAAAGAAADKARRARGPRGRQPVIGCEPGPGQRRRGLVALGDRREQRCELGAAVARRAARTVRSPAPNRRRARPGPADDARAGGEQAVRSAACGVVTRPGHRAHRAARYRAPAAPSRARPSARRPRRRRSSPPARR